MLLHVLESNEKSMVGRYYCKPLFQEESCPALLQRRELIFCKIAYHWPYSVRYVRTLDKSCMKLHTYLHNFSFCSCTCRAQLPGRRKIMRSRTARQRVGRYFSSPLVITPIAHINLHNRCNDNESPSSSSVSPSSSSL